MSIIDKIPPNKQLILFDGVCNFCDETIQKVIKADKNNVFVFASLQSDFGKEIIKYIGVNPSVDSIILYNPGVAYYTESDAALEWYGKKDECMIPSSEVRSKFLS